MASILGTIFGAGGDLDKDSVIANDMLAGSKAGAAAYLTSSLECATPEIRRIFGQYSQQMAQGHEGLTELAVNKGWYKPYDEPEAQLQQVYEQSQEFISLRDQ